MKGPEMLGGVAGAALCCTAVSGSEGRCGKQASKKHRSVRKNTPAYADMNPNVFNVLALNRIENMRQR